MLRRKESGELAYRDMLISLLWKLMGSFAVLVVLEASLLQQQVKTIEEQKKEGEEPPGKVIVEAKWKETLNTDVDLWVQAPGDVPVGYSNKGGLIFNLLRDDLGTYADPTELNMENSYSRGTPPGEYFVNVHLFSNSAGIYPVEVLVTARCRPDNNSSSVVIHSRKVNLNFIGHEVTAFRFTMKDDKCGFDPDSINGVFRALRAAPGK